MKEGTKHIKYWCDIICDEGRFKFEQAPAHSIMTHSSEGDTEPVGVTCTPPAPRPEQAAPIPEPKVEQPLMSPERAIIPPKCYDFDDHTYLTESQVNFVHSAFNAEFKQEPSSMTGAMDSPDAVKWQEAAQT